MLFHPLQAKVGGGTESKIDQALPNHTAALELVSGFLGDAFHGVSHSFSAVHSCCEQGRLELILHFLGDAIHGARLLIVARQQV